MKLKAMVTTMFGVLLTGIVVTCAQVFAQEGPIEYLAIQFYENAPQIYRVDSAGNYEALEDMNSAISGIYEDGWSTITIDQFILSPDGRHIAFSAYRNQTEGQEAALFVYTLGEQGLHRVSTPAVGAPRWSPASDAIALAPRWIRSDAFLLQDLYLYDLASDTLVLLTDIPNTFVSPEVTWLPDNQHIVFVGPSVRCTTGCGYAVRNLYVVDRDGENVVRLTDLEAQLPPRPDPEYPLYWSCLPIQVTWSHTASRIYYAASGVERYDEMLFSVNLSGDNRLEADLPAMYLDDERTEIRSILPSVTNDDVFIVVDAVESLPFTGDTPVEWRILRIDQAGNETSVFVFDHPGGGPIFDVAFSPSEQYIALSAYNYMTADTYGFVMVVDLNSGQTVIENGIPDRACEIAWVSDEVLLFHTVAEGCYAGPNRIWSLDISTNTAEEITPDLDGLVWVLFPPEVVEPDPH